jgi:hypothetical protein
MKEEFSLDRLKALVVTTFENGPPNGWRLGWDENRFYDVVSTAAQPADCVNHTSFDYSFCNTLVVTPIARSDLTLTLTVRVSFVAPFYSTHWTRYRPKDAQVVSAVPSEVAEIADRIRKALCRLGFTEMPLEWHDETVQGVVLELSGATNVTLSKCLFEDYEGPDEM